MGIVGGRGEILMAHHQLWSQQEPHFSPHSTAKKAHSSGRIVSSSTSDVVIASVHSEKTCLKNLMMMKIMMMNISPEKTGLQYLISAM